MTSQTGHTRPTTARRATLAGAALIAALLLLAATAAPAAAIGLGTQPDIAAAAAALGVVWDTGPPPLGLGSGADASARADVLRERAREAQRAHLFSRAYTLYDRARDLYLAAGETRPARACLTRIHDIVLIAACYPYTRQEMLDILAATYPTFPPEERESWLDLPTTESLRWDGQRHFFSDLPDNLAYRDWALFVTRPGWVEGHRHAYALILPYLAAAAAAPPWQPYAAPATHTYVQTLAAPRDKLPADGDLRLWFPLPVNGGAQTAVEISAITPTTWLRYPPSIDQDIGLLYMLVPLQTLATDLDVTFQVRYLHAAQYFKIDPARVGRYDRDGALFERFTASRGNTRITPSIRRLARRLAGGEKNPYLRAQRIYDYVVTRVQYSFMPHLALWPRGMPESVYVHRHKYGDCGAQSMYFAALCRSLGVPARCTGGYQTFSGKPGPHFWAEIYLPDYGWIPVDTSMAQIVDCVPETTPAERAAFHAFYFGGQDDLRLTVQKDVDLPLIPPAHSRIFFPGAIQVPAATCPTTEEMIDTVLRPYWTFE